MKFANQKFIWLILSLIAFSLQANAQKKVFDESVLSGKGKEAYRTLLKTELFAFGGTDVSGVRSSGEDAFRVLIKEKKAVSAFRNLNEKAAPEGALYALLGLRALKCECFNDEFQKFINLSEPPKRVKDTFYIGKDEIGLAIPEGNVQRGGNGIHFYEKRLDAANDIRAGKFDEFIKQKEKLKKQRRETKREN
jgi:hypothetical protein